MHVETLKTFCDLVESGRFETAAHLNRVSQSAVSQQLKALEARYGQRLIDRGAHRTLTPTEAGRVLYADFRDIVDRLAGLDERLRSHTGTVGGSVRVATVYSVGLHRLPPYVKRFVHAFPAVKVQVEYSRTDRVRDACLDRTIDLGIVACPPRHPHLAVVPWCEERLVLVCPPGHSFSSRRRGHLAALAGEPFIAFERDIPTRRLIDRALRARGIRPRIAMAFDNVETIKRSVEAGNGVSILPETTVATERATGQLVAIDGLGPDFSRGVAIIHRRDRALSAAANAFVGVLTGAGEMGVRGRKTTGSRG